MFGRYVLLPGSFEHPYSLLDVLPGSLGFRSVEFRSVRSPVFLDFVHRRRISFRISFREDSGVSIEHRSGSLHSWDDCGFYLSFKSSLHWSCRLQYSEFVYVHSELFHEIFHDVLRFDRRQVLFEERIVFSSKFLTEFLIPIVDLFRLSRNLAIDSLWSGIPGHEPSETALVQRVCKIGVIRRIRDYSPCKRLSCPDDVLASRLKVFESFRSEDFHSCIYHDQIN